MKQKLKQIQSLKHLSDVKLNMNLARLSDVANEEQKIRDILANLDEAVAEQRSFMKAGGNDASQAMCLGMDTKWASWVQAEKRKHMKSLAIIAQKREQQLVETRRAFGRVEALKGIAKKMQT